MMVKNQNTLIIANSADPVVPNFLGQLGIAYRYSKLALDTFDLAANKEFPNLNIYPSILLVCPPNMHANQEWQTLLEAYVRNGGGLVIFNPKDNPVVCRLAGIQEFAPSSDKTSILAGSAFVTFLLDLYPTFEDLGQVFISGNPVAKHRLDDTVGVGIVAKSSSGAPFAWRRTFGDGKVFVWNTALVQAVWGRSAIVQSVLSVQTVAVRGIANVAMVQVDDFPAPFGNVEAEPVRSELNMSMLEFLDQVWLPDMLQLAEQFGISYSFAIPFNYNERIEEPFGFEEWEAESVSDGNKTVPFAVHFARMIEPPHELGLHGYNHIPLCIDNWGSSEAMMAALNAVAKRWKSDALGALPSSYVPPMNEYDKAGALALSECLPSLTVICGDSPTGTGRPKGGREFEAEPWNQQLFCLPRRTCGYQLTHHSKVAMVAELAELGVWTHFLHPDDIFDIQQNSESLYSLRNAQSLGWRSGDNGGMRGQLQHWFEFVATNFPWLRYVSATRAGEEIKQHLENDLTVVYADAAVEIRSDIPRYIQLRLNRDDGSTGYRDFETSNHSQTAVLDLYEGTTYNLWTLHIPAGVSKFEFQ